MGRAIEFADQTIRDGIGSLWGQRIHSDMVLPVADVIRGMGYSVVDMPLTAVRFPVAARLFRANPWDEADAILGAFPGVRRRIPIRPNSVQFGLAADSVVDLWIERITAHGMNSFWLQDVMYQIDKMARVVPVIKAHGAEAMMAIMYGLSPYHTDDFFADKTRQLAAIPGVDGIYVEDTAGVLTPDRAATLLPAIVEAAGGLPVELHVHNTTGLAPLDYLCGVDAGVTTLHTASAPLANGASLPSTERTVGNLELLGHDCPIDRSALPVVAAHFEEVADLYGLPIGVPAEYDAAVATHQLPGGMMGTLERQLSELGLAERSPALLEEIARVREDLGYPIMATPVSQFVGTQAVLNVARGARYEVVPDEVIRYLLAHYGEPAGPVNDEVRDRVLGSPRAEELAAQELAQPSRDELRARFGMHVSDDELMLRLLVSAADLENVEASRSPAGTRSSSRLSRTRLRRVLEAGSLEYLHLERDGYSVTARRSWSVQKKLTPGVGA